MDQLQEDKIKAIRSCYLFENTEDDIIERLAKVSVIETPKAQSPLFEAGDEPDGLRIIMSGLVRIWVNDEETGGSFLIPLPDVSSSSGPG